MSQSNNSARDPFDEQISALLARAATSVTPSSDFARQVRRAATGGASRRLRPSLNFSLAALKPLGSVALIALVVVAFAWALVGRGWSGFHADGGHTSDQKPSASACVRPVEPYDPNPTPVANSEDHSIAINASAAAGGITITLDRAYADATQTVVTYHVNPGDNGSPITLTSPDLIDAASAHYPLLINSAHRQPDGHIENMIVFAPLPQSELGSSQRLTFYATSAESPSDGQSAGNVVSGPWIIRFTITPVAGTAIPLSLPAQTHNGVTIQPIEVDVAPAGGGLDGQSGGLRVRYRVSGLPTDMQLADVADYPTSFTSATTAGTAGGGSAPGGPACHDLLTLKLANGQMLIPGFIFATGQYVPDQPSLNTGVIGPTVGASGSAEAQALFFAPIPPGTVTMTINSSLVSSMRDGTINGVPIDAHIVQGPWVFDIPVQVHP